MFYTRSITSGTTTNVRRTIEWRRILTSNQTRKWTHTHARIAPTFWRLNCGGGGRCQLTRKSILRERERERENVSLFIAKKKGKCLPVLKSTFFFTHFTSAHLTCTRRESDLENWADETAATLLLWGICVSFSPSVFEKVLATKKWRLFIKNQSRVKRNVRA